MLNLLFPLLLGLAASSTNAASLPKPTFGPPISLNLTDLYSYSMNTTLLDDRGSFGAIDPSFKVACQLGDTPLRPMATLINAVHAMANLALQDFYAIIGPVVVQLPSYPDVVIRSIAPALSPQTIPLRFTMWGIWTGVAFMLDNQRFVTMHLTLSYNGIVVGYIVFEKPSSQLLTPAGSTDDSSAGSLEKMSDVALNATSPSTSLADPTNTTSLSLTNITVPSSNADGLRVFVAPFGQGISVSDFFKPILACIAHVAPFPSTDRVTRFMLYRADSDMRVEFRDYDPQPRTEAPFFEYQLITKAMRLLPATVLQLGRWTEVIVVMQVNGIKVGDGWLKKVVP